MMKLAKLALLTAGVLLVPTYSHAEFGGYGSLPEFNQVNQARLPQLNANLDAFPGSGSAVGSKPYDPTLSGGSQKWLGDKPDLVKKEAELQFYTKKRDHEYEIPATLNAIKLSKLQDKERAKDEIKKSAASIPTSVPPMGRMPRASEQVCNNNVNFDSMNQMLALSGKPIQEYITLLTKYQKQTDGEDKQRKLKAVKDWLNTMSQAQPDRFLEQQAQSEIKNDAQRSIWLDQKIGERKAEYIQAKQTGPKYLAKYLTDSLETDDTTEEIQALGRNRMTEFVNNYIVPAYNSCVDSAQALWRNCDQQAKRLGRNNPGSVDTSTGFGMALKEAQDFDNLNVRAAQGNPAGATQEFSTKQQQFYALAQQLSCPRVADSCGQAFGPQVQAQFQSVGSAPDVASMNQAITNAMRSLQAGLANFSQTGKTQIGNLAHMCDKMVEAYNNAKKYATERHQGNQQRQQEVAQFEQQTGASRAQEQQTNMMMMMMGIQGFIPGGH